MSQNCMNEIAILAAKRTAIGSFLGGLSDVPAHILGGTVISHILAEIGIEPGEISRTIMGQVLTAICGQNPARQAAVVANIPFEKPAFTVNQVCGSGLFSIILGAQSILLRESKFVVAGGQENMSMAPHALKIRKPHKFGDKELVDTMMLDGLQDAIYNYHMGVTAENVAKTYKISREEQDAFALESHRRAAASQNSGHFAKEIIEIIHKSKACMHDEHIRPDTSIEALSKLKTSFAKDSATVTAGNSSGINDGASAVIIAPLSEAEKRNIKPLGLIKSYATVGVDPAIMGIAPKKAIEEALKIADWSKDSVELFEINEAFAAQSVAVIKELDLDTKIVNSMGGAIALGHPIGASGARCLTTLLNAMKHKKAHRGVVSLCVGGGMGVAMCVENTT